jgi:hypothetical protein
MLAMWLPRHSFSGPGGCSVAVALLVSVHFRLPLVEDLLVRVQLQESQKTRSYLDSNLQLMATRLGELQGQVLQLDALGDRVSGLAGIQRERPGEAAKGPQGGPYLPAPMSPYALQDEIDRLAGQVERYSDDLVYLEARLLDKRVKDRLLPTTLPVKDATLGSFFGYRTDPFAGLRAMHEGLDFRTNRHACRGAADGVVWRPAFTRYTQLIEVDHGRGDDPLCPLSRMDVSPAPSSREAPDRRRGITASTGALISKAPVRCGGTGACLGRGRICALKRVTPRGLDSGRLSAEGRVRIALCCTAQPLKNGISATQEDFGSAMTD